MVGQRGPVRRVVQISKPFGRINRFVRFVKAHKQKKRLRLVAQIGQPVNRFVGHNLSRIAFDLSDRLAVSHKVNRVVMSRQRVILRRKPVIESMIRRLRLSRTVEIAVEMPFARVTRRITGSPQQRGDGDFRFRHVHRRIHRNPVVNADAIRSSTRHQPGPGRRTVRRRRVATRQPQTFGRKAVKVRRIDPRMPVTGQIAVPQIVRQHDQKVRPLAV